MNKWIKLISLLSLVTMFSCRSSQELIYMKDAVNQVPINGLALENTEHLLKPGDILFVSIKTMNAEVNAVFNPESNMELGGQTSQKYNTPNGAYLYGYEIGPDGTIQLPMLGNIRVAGVTVSDAGPLVQKKANEFINDAIVKVKQLNFKFMVSGEVKNPGVYYNYNNSITVLEALAMANGNTDFAAIKNVMVFRPGTDGKYMPYLLNLSSKEAFMSEAFYLNPNDIIIVQPDKHKNFQLNSQAYSLMFSSLSVLLAVLGFVLK